MALPSRQFNDLSMKKRKSKKNIFSAERPDLVVAASGGGGGVVAETVRVAVSLQTTNLTAFDGLFVEW